LSISTVWTISLPERSFSVFFQQQPSLRLLSEILLEARRATGMTVDQASVAARIPLGDVLALEGGRSPGHACSRIHAVTYARVLGLDPVELRDLLPGSPALLPKGQGQFLRNTSRRERPPLRISLELLSPLAPLGRAVVTLLLVSTLLGTWGMVRQLSRVRSIPWITTNSHPSSFFVR
jgi:cytoskeletal protein RodZ